MKSRRVQWALLLYPPCYLNQIHFSSHMAFTQVSQQSTCYCSPSSPASCASPRVRCGLPKSIDTDHSYPKGLVPTRWHTSPNQRRSARWRLHRRAVNATCWNYAWCIVIDVCFSEKWRHVRKKYTKRMRRKSKKNTHKTNPTKILTKIHKTNVTKFEKKSLS